jgi:predicted CXXCH cytochrome family protein
MRHGILLAGLTALVICVTFPALGATPGTVKDKGPDMINFKMGNMSLEFKHKKHIAALNNECFHCHKSEKGKIDGWGKETAHTICIPCHDLNDKGPVECQQCHAK